MSGLPATVEAFLLPCFSDSVPFDQIRADRLVRIGPGARLKAHQYWLDADTGELHHPPIAQMFLKAALITKTPIAQE